MSLAPAVAVVLLWAAGEAPPPAPSTRTIAGPARTGHRIHVLVSEEIDPDGLRSLARPGVTLWVRTRSNMLRASIAEALAGFAEAYVQLRPPVLAAHIAQLDRASGVGIWLEEAALEGRGLHLRGPRRMAVRVAGELTPERIERIQRARPSALLWEPGGQVGLDAWSAFVQLPGDKVVDLGIAASESGVRSCGPWTRDILRGVGLRQDLSRLPDALLPSFVCPARARIKVSASIGDATLGQLFTANPATELEVEAGPGPGEVRAARRLLDRLEAVSWRPAHQGADGLPGRQPGVE